MLQSTLLLFVKLQLFVQTSDCRLTSVLWEQINSLTRETKGSELYERKTIPSVS